MRMSMPRAPTYGRRLGAGGSGGDEAMKKHLRHQLVNPNSVGQLQFDE